MFLLRVLFWNNIITPCTQLLLGEKIKAHEKQDGTERALGRPVCTDSCSLPSLSLFICAMGAYAIRQASQACLQGRPAPPVPHQHLLGHLLPFCLQLLAPVFFLLQAGLHLMQDLLQLLLLGCQPDPHLLGLSKQLRLRLQLLLQQVLLLGQLHAGVGGIQ